MVRPCDAPLILSLQDEPFHVRQTQQYCRGDYGAWDPKITTFPGLYVFGTGWGRAAAALLQLVPNAQVSLELQQAVSHADVLKGGLARQVELCSTSALRSLNLVFLFAAYAVAAALCRRLHPGVSRSQSYSVVRP